MVRRLITLGMVVAVCGLVGCGDPGGAATAKVDGTITLDGAPLPNVNINFNPAAAKGGGRPASGTSDSSGKFTVSSFKPKDGAMPGPYFVTVTGEGVPDKYKTEKTDLKVNVEAGKTNAVKLDLKKGE